MQTYLEVARSFEVKVSRVYTGRSLKAFMWCKFTNACGCEIRATLNDMLDKLTQRTRSG